MKRQTRLYVVRFQPKRGGIVATVMLPEYLHEGLREIIQAGWRIVSISKTKG